jgi:hypothetical protein
MSPHTFGPHGRALTSTGASSPLAPVATARMGTPDPRSFVVRVRFATTAARASGFEVVAAEARVGGAGESGRLGWVVETPGHDLLILVDGAADPDAALGVATEALRESLVGFQVTMVGPPDGAMLRSA